MRKGLMEMALVSAAGMVGSRMSHRGGRGMRLAGRGLTNAAWLVPLGAFVTRKVRDRRH